MMDKKSVAKLNKAYTTTRGTPRRRAHKGLAQELRYQALKELPTEALQRILRRKLNRMSPDRRLEVEAQLGLVSHEGRRELLERILSRP